MPAAWVGAAAAVVGVAMQSHENDKDKGQGAANAAADISRDQWNYYKSNYQPLESNLIDQAQKAGSPEEFARARGAANADVTGGFDSARKQTKARIESYGLNPGSPAYQSMLASTDIAEGATKAGALTAADNNTRNLAYSKALDVVGLGRNIPAQSAASSVNAANASTNAQKLAFQRNQANAQSTGYAVGQLGNAAMKWYGSPSTTNVGTGYGSATDGGRGGSMDYTDSSGNVQPQFAKGGKISKEGIGYEDDEEFEAPQRGTPNGTVGGGTRAYADGGVVIDAEKTGDDTYDATALKGVLQSKGINPRVAHEQAHGAAARHKGAITPHMKHRFASGGGVGRQGLEGPDASEAGKLQGPGTETSDSIPAVIDGEKPAALSTGEVVMNAEVPKLSGDEILEALNAAGMKKREASGLEPRASNDSGENEGERAYVDGGVVRASQADVRKSEPRELPGMLRTNGTYGESRFTKSDDEDEVRVGLEDADVRKRVNAKPVPNARQQPRSNNGLIGVRG